MNSTLAIGVSIKLNGVTATDTSVGIYNGYLNYSESDAIIYNKPYKVGVLSKNWVTSIAKSVDVRRSGNYASLNGSTIKLSNNFGLLEWLKENEISLYNQKISIEYSYINESGSNTRGSLYTGIITKVTPHFDYIDIKTESVSKGYKSPASELIYNTDIYKPMFIGDTSTDKSDNVQYTKGISVDNGINDIIDGATPYFWKVYISTSDRIIIKCINKTLTTQQLNDYVSLIYSINNSNQQGDPYISVIDGSGSGELFTMVSSHNTIEVNSINSTLTIRLGNGVAGTKNVTPDGILGVVYDPWKDGTYEPSPSEYSIIKFVEVDKYIQMDGWVNTENGYAGKSYLYAEGEGFQEAPTYKGGFINSGDRMVQVKQTGETYLPFKNFSDGGANTPVQHAFGTDLDSLSVGDLPEDFKKFWCFGTSQYQSHGIYAQMESINAPVTENIIVSERFIYDNDYDSFAELSITRGTIPDTSPILPQIPDNTFQRTGLVYKCGMPDFKKSPNKMYFTGDVAIRSKNQSGYDTQTDKAVFLMVHDYRGWNFISGKWSENIGGTGNTEDPAPAGGTYKYLSNLFPESVEGGYTDDDNLYNYYDNNTVGYKSNGIMIVNKMSLEFDLDDFLLTSQSKFFVFLCARGTGVSGTLSYCKWTTKQLAISAEYDSEPDKTAFSYVGRAFDNSSSRANKIIYANVLYDHILRLQNYTIQGIEKPLNGWGSDYPTATWSSLIDYSSNNGGTNNPSLATTYELEGQKLTFSDMNTTAMKNELNRTMWSMGTISNDGVEKVYPLIPSISEDIGTVIKYSDIEGKYKFNPTQYSDIFTQGKIRYNYNDVVGDFQKEISITNVDAPSYQSTFVTGIEGIESIKAELSAKLWKLASKLYQTYNIIAEFPSDLGEVKLIKDQDGAVDFLLKLYEWQGVREEGENLVVDERYTATFTVGLDFYIEQGLDHGSPIQLEIPTIAPSGSEHKGIITDISISISAKPVVVITAQMRGDITGGGGWSEIHETGSQPTDIVESGTEDTNIIEGN